MKRRQVRLGGLMHVLRYLAPELGPHRRTLALTGVCMLGVTAMQLLAPWPLKVVFDNVLVPDVHSSTLVEQIPDGWLLPLVAAAILVIALVLGLFAYGQSYLAASIGQKVVASIRYRVYCHLQRLSQSFHESAETGDLLSRLTADIRMMRELLVNALMFIVDRSVAIVAMLSIMLVMNWQLALIGVAIVPLLAMAITHYSGRIKAATRRQRRRESAVTQTLHEKLTAIRVVQAHAREAYEEERFSQQNSSSANAALAATKLEAPLNRFVQVILAVGTAGVVWFGATLVQGGALTPGELLVFTTYLAALYKPVRKLASVTARLAKATASGERIVDVLETRSDVVEAADAMEVGRFRGDIRLDDVHFTYPGGGQVLRGATVSITAGTTVALIGASGAGKSTLGNLLFRFYDPDRGVVRIDGLDVRSLQLQALRSQISVILQEPLLFNVSVRENIAYGRLDATEDEIMAAARAANAHEFITDLPAGYDSVVGERGGALSGGQRQRICIARALVQDAALAILDEPTTGLDNVARAEVERSLKVLMRGRTCIYITHDLNQAVNADRILEVRNGVLRDIGPEALSAPRPIPLGLAT